MEFCVAPPAWYSASKLPTSSSNLETREEQREVEGKEASSRSPLLNTLHRHLLDYPFSVLTVQYRMKHWQINYSMNSFCIFHVKMSKFRKMAVVWRLSC